MLIIVGAEECHRVICNGGFPTISEALQVYPPYHLWRRKRLSKRIHEDYCKRCWDGHDAEWHLWQAAATICSNFKCMHCKIALGFDAKGKVNLKYNSTQKSKFGSDFGLV